MKKIYENKKIRVFWEPEKCFHSGNCLLGLPQVFDNRKRPWIDINAAEVSDIKRCIDTCPSGALSYEVLR
jgi:uncharacterized Fe-S cluster protein YjdI